MSQRPRSLQHRLLGLIIGLMVGVWLVTAVATWFDVQHELDELLDSHLAQAATLLAVRQGHELDEDRAFDAPRLHHYARRVTFQVFHEGRLVARSPNAPEQAMVALADFRQRGDHDQPGSYRTIRLGDEDWRVFSTQGSDHDVQVIVGEQMSSRASILAAVLRSTLWPMALSLPLLAFAVWWAVRRGMAPLRRLERSLDERQPDSLEAVVLAEAPSEMVPMVEALNRLFARITELMEGERRFTADAAHELRTPIAAIRMQAQVAMGETDSELRRHALEGTLAGCDRATRLVEQLLTLSRLEAGANPTSTSVDLGAIVRSVVGELATQALAKTQTIEVDTTDDVIINGDATLLAVLVRNLVDNAIRYCPTGARIKLRVSRLSNLLQLRVEDNGPGIPDEALKRVGERFFRVVGSGQSGSGLGWSIVRRIATAHHATIRMERSDIGGLAVSIEWPDKGIRRV